jgi:hypothetical protein
VSRLGWGLTRPYGAATVKKYREVRRAFDRCELTISQGGAVGKTPMLMLRKAVQYRQHDADTAALSTEIHVL